MSDSFPEDDIPIKDPYQFYNNRYLRRHDGSSPQVHSYTGENGTGQYREKRKIKLFPVLGDMGSDGTFVATDNKMDGTYSNGDQTYEPSDYLPAQLNVQDLLPGKQDGDKQPLPNGDVVIVTAHDSSVLGEMKVNLAAQDNPYNQINQKFHSALWFPGCIFLFFLFCMPAMMHMRRSDEAYADHDFKLARKHGAMSTALYIGGTIFGLCFYAFVIFVAIYFTKYY